jgi:hypothetical protein
VFSYGVVTVPDSDDTARDSDSCPSKPLSHGIVTVSHLNSPLECFMLGLHRPLASSMMELLPLTLATGFASINAESISSSTLDSLFVSSNSASESDSCNVFFFFSSFVLELSSVGLPHASPKLHDYNFAAYPHSASDITYWSANSCAGTCPVLPSLSSYYHYSWHLLSPSSQVLDPYTSPNLQSQVPLLSS